MTRVFIADDHAIVRCGIKQALRDLGGFEIVGEAENGRQVLNAPDIDRWDVLVLDLSLPKVNGPEVLRRLKARRPDLAVVVLSMYPEEQYARRMFAAGATAYLSKERPPEDLVAAVRAAARGERYPAANAAKATSSEAAAKPLHHALSKRENQIFMLVVRGHAVAAIAAELDVHSCTISNHLAKIRQKLGVGSVAELVGYAYAHGLENAAPRLDDG
jgi:two-component system, NarL family, invasion response regulator UvrY